MTETTMPIMTWIAAATIIDYIEDNNVDNNCVDIEYGENKFNNNGNKNNNIIKVD